MISWCLSLFSSPQPPLSRHGPILRLRGCSIAARWLMSDSWAGNMIYDFISMFVRNYCTRGQGRFSLACCNYGDHVSRIVLWEAATPFKKTNGLSQPTPVSVTSSPGVFNWFSAIRMDCVFKQIWTTLISLVFLDYPSREGVWGGAAIKSDSLQTNKIPPVLVIRAPPLQRFLVLMLK